MSSINSNITSLFSSLQSSSSGIYSLDLNQLSSIKSGSYKKLLNKYYSQDEEEDTTTTSSTINSTIKSSAEKNTETTIKSASAAVVKDVKTLTSSSLWEKKTTTDSEGNETTDYDRDAIYKAVSSFVKDYNDLVDSAADSNITSTLRSANFMVKSININSGILSSVGITVNSDNSLSLDKDTLDKADVSTLKSIFAQDASIANQISASASTMNSNATSALAKLAATGSYDSDGGYTYVTGSNYNSII